VAQSRQRDPRLRDARAYILPADQPDLPTAIQFVDALVKSGVKVLRATAPFSVNGRRYPSGSFIVKTAQAFRPHLLDMFEPQEFPRDTASPGAAPIAPYDIAGWTLAFQMGVRFDRILEAVAGPFEVVSTVVTPPGQVSGSARPAGYLFSHHQNNSFAVVNRLLAAREDVYWLPDRNIGSTDRTGSMYVAAGGSTLARIHLAARDLGVSFVAVSRPPAGGTMKVRPVRIGLWDQYGGSTASGWTRWLLERFEFPFERVYAQALDAGNLGARFDVIIFPDDAVPSNRSRREDGSGIDDLPAEYRPTTGAISWDKTVPRLKEFVERGGTLLLVGRATAMGERLGLPPFDRPAVKESDGARPLKRDEYFVPGSILQVAVDNTNPLAYGFNRHVDVFFDNSPVFGIDDDGTKVVATADEGGPLSRRRVAWFASATPLRSGWAWGQHRLAGGVAVVDVRLGEGRIAMFGPQITFRGQSYATFKFLFNGIFYGNAQSLPQIPVADR
jgi:hypothetical protein